MVVEAAPRSGSLIAARYAAEFGREVMSVPGSPPDPRAQGCNGFIREGATLVQNADDVLESLGPLGARAARPSRDYRAGPVEADARARERDEVLRLLGPTPVPVDELIRQSGLAPAVVQTVLLELELAGRLERYAGRKASLV